MSTENDSELLRLAAKAAGIDLRFLGGVTPFSDGPVMVGEWNPLTDDGDALRLGVRRHVFFNPLFAHYLALERFGNQDSDDTKAYRRAIVRTVAAEIGRAMP
jgi:hypothetical protein